MGEDRGGPGRVGKNERTGEDCGVPAHRQRRQDEVVVLALLCSRKLGGVPLGFRATMTPLIKRLS